MCLSGAHGGIDGDCAKSPDKNRIYECKFTFCPSLIPYHCAYVPSNEYVCDVISLADTDAGRPMVEPQLRLYEESGETE